MKGIAYIMILAFLALGMFGLWYIVLDRVFDTYTYPWGQSNIIDANMTAWQTFYKIAWDGSPVIVVFAFMVFLFVWAQKREGYEYV